MSSPISACRIRSRSCSKPPDVGKLEHLVKATQAQAGQILGINSGTRSY